MPDYKNNKKKTEAFTFAPTHYQDKGPVQYYIVEALSCILVIVIVIINILFISSFQDQLSDCRFECNHLQTRLTQCQELSDCAEALEQTLPALAWAQVRALNEEIKQKRHLAYEGRELPLIWK